MYLPIIIRRIDLSMIARCQGGHLVPVDRVHGEEELHLLGDLLRSQLLAGSPLMHQLHKHRVGTTSSWLTKPSIPG